MTVEARVIVVRFDKRLPISNTVCENIVIESYGSRRTFVSEHL